MRTKVIAITEEEAEKFKAAAKKNAYRYDGLIGTIQRLYYVFMTPRTMVHAHVLLAYFSMILVCVFGFLVWFTPGESLAAIGGVGSMALMIWSVVRIPINEDS